MKGICFKPEMFHATIEGRKTQTRRILNPQPDGFRGFVGNDMFVPQTVIGMSVKEIKPRYKVGETLYLKEPYMFAPNVEFGIDTNGNGIRYKYSESAQYIEEWETEFENKLFMPAKYARYFIEITDVRWERLQDISEEDCLKEGISEKLSKVLGWLQYGISGKERYGTPQEAYAALIDKINGKGIWQSNPCVWIYDYKLTNRR